TASATPSHPSSDWATTICDQAMPADGSMSFLLAWESSALIVHGWEGSMPGAVVGYHPQDRVAVCFVRGQWMSFSGPPPGASPVATPQPTRAILFVPEAGQLASEGRYGSEESLTPADGPAAAIEGMSAHTGPPLAEWAERAS